MCLGVRQRLVESGAFLLGFFRFLLGGLFDLTSFQDFATVEALDVLRLVILGDELRAFVLAGGSWHGAVR